MKQYKSPNQKITYMLPRLVKPIKIVRLGDIIVCGKGGKKKIKKKNKEKK